MEFEAAEGNPGVVFVVEDVVVVVVAVVEVVMCVSDVPLEDVAEVTDASVGAA